MVTFFKVYSLKTRSPNSTLKLSVWIHLKSIPTFISNIQFKLSNILWKEITTRLVFCCNYRYIFTLYTLAVFGPIKYPLWIIWLFHWNSFGNNSFRNWLLSWKSIRYHWYEWSSTITSLQIRQRFTGFQKILEHVLFQKFCFIWFF